MNLEEDKRLFEAVVEAVISGCSVASQLSTLGDSAFLAAEDSVLVSSSLPGQGVLSCTGSNPLGGWTHQCVL